MPQTQALGIFMIINILHLKRNWLLYIAFVWLCFSHQSVAQINDATRQYRHWRVDVLAGKAFGWQPGNRLGLQAAAEARYNFDDALAFGLRVGLLQMARGYYDASYQLMHSKRAESASILGTADYYVNNNRVRTFIGGGTGIFNLTSGTLTLQNGSLSQAPSEARFGWMLRTGAEVNHLRLAAEFHGIGKSAGVYNHYFSLSLGLFIGGGKIKTEHR